MKNFPAVFSIVTSAEAGEINSSRSASNRGARAITDSTRALTGVSSTLMSIEEPAAAALRSIGTSTVRREGSINVASFSPALTNCPSTTETR